MKCLDCGCNVMDCGCSGAVEPGGELPADCGLRDLSGHARDVGAVARPPLAPLPDPSHSVFECDDPDCASCLEWWADELADSAYRERVGD